MMLCNRVDCGAEVKTAGRLLEAIKWWSLTFVQAVDFANVVSDVVAGIVDAHQGVECERFGDISV